MTRVAIYARYSSDRQNERSVSDQVAICSAHAEAKGWEVVRLFSDAAISGSAMGNRPGLLDALTAAERGEYDVLLAEDEDRFARDLEHQAHVFNRIGEAGAQLWTIATGRVELMHIAMKGFMAQDFIRNLSAKTKRGVRSNAEKGLATGSRLYGYATQPGGHTEVVDAEAAVIREIFQRYAEGETAREIASALNARGVAGPRGGLWNTSTISGSRQRANGVLNTEQYVGVKVWGRMDVRKDRTTGKRRPKMLPEADWKRTPVPELRIVDDATWATVRARKSRATASPQQAQRRPALFSGLLKCGVCGGSYTTYSTGKIVCVNYRERGTCTNRRTPARAAVEAEVLDGLRDDMLSPEAIALYVRTYRYAAKARRASANARRAPIAKRLGELERAGARIVDAIARGVASAPMEAKLGEIEAEKAQLAAALADAEQEPNTVELFPEAPRIYAQMVERLQDTLRSHAQGATLAERQLADAVRGLIDKVVITPLSQDRGGPIDVVLHGTLARFLDERSGNAGLGGVVAGASYVSTQPEVPLVFRRRLAG